MSWLMHWKNLEILQDTSNWWSKCMGHYSESILIRLPDRFWAIWLYNNYHPPKSSANFSLAQSTERWIPVIQYLWSSPFLSELPFIVKIKNVLKMKNINKINSKSYWQVQLPTLHKEKKYFYFWIRSRSIVILSSQNKLLFVLCNFE